MVALLEAKLLGDLLLGGLVRLDVQLVQNGQGGLNNKQIIFLKIFYWVFNTFGTSAVLRTIGLAGTRTPASADAGCYSTWPQIIYSRAKSYFILTPRSKQFVTEALILCGIVACRKVNKLLPAQLC